jgi:tetratricopeptide (TPR) repeat protein
MLNCAAYEGDLAAALYEELGVEEQARLDQHLAECAACRAEAVALRAFTKALPQTRASFTGDLRPVLRAELERAALVKRRFAWGALAAGLVMALFVGLGLSPELSMPVEVAENVEETGVASGEAVQLAARAREMAESGNYVDAYTSLVSALDEELADAGILQLALADIEFAHGQRYAQAFEAYDTLKRRYPEVWSQSSGETKDRYDLLVETRDDAYQPLYALDAADSFERLEQVLARYPERQMVAQRTVTRMAEAVGADATPGVAVRVAALEAVRTRCTEPLAVAQLSMALGDLYWKELADPVRARPLYESALGAGHTMLAQRAQAAIGELDRLGRP